MLQIITSYDIKLFYFFNNKIANPIFDWLMPVITNQDNWFLIYIALTLLLILKGGKKGKIVVLLLIPTILLSDQLSSQILKPLVGRIRPCYTLPDVRLLVACGGKYAFPSGHATNSFATALVLSYFYPRFSFLLFSMAGTVSFSRIYVGVHYPLDVLAGIIIGIVCGMLILYLYNLIKKRYNF